MGSSSYITNLDGEVVQHVEYVPFGEVFLEEKNAVWNTPYLFNGKELDKETGMSYYGARYYDSKISVWLSVDPLAEEFSGWSPYNYCLNNPVRFLDPDGRGPVDHWQLNKSVKLELIKKTNDNFNVFFDENGIKLFQTNQVSKEGLKWSTKTEEYLNKVTTVFLKIIRCHQKLKHNIFIKKHFLELVVMN